MGKPKRNELFAEYYLNSIAAIWIDPDGHVGAQDVAHIHRRSIAGGATASYGDFHAERLAYCCARGAQFVRAYRLHMWKQEHMTLCPLPVEIAAKLKEWARRAASA
jgi:hypothetical protein